MESLVKILISLVFQVSGHFTYGVMALSAATFMFWNLFGTRILPIASYHGSTVSLALQLSCSVLVILEIIVSIEEINSCFHY